MAEFKSCFIIENNEYKEITPAEIMENGVLKPAYQGRFFYPFGPYLMEVSSEDRRFFYQEQERIKTLRKKRRKGTLEILSLDALCERASEDGSGCCDIAMDLTVDTEAQAELEIMKERLRDARSKLTPEDNLLLREYYENGKTEREIAVLMGKSQSMIHKQRRSILDKLLKMMNRAK